MTRKLADPRPDDSGSALVMVLLFMTLFAVLIGMVLSFGQTSLKAATVVRGAGASTYAADGAADAALNTIRLNGTQTDPGGVIPTNNCLTLPAGQLDNPTALAVTCLPRTGSGTSGATPLSVPKQAILAPSPGAGTDGVALAGGAQIDVTGSVMAARQLTAPAGTRLTSTTGVKATVCSLGGVVAPAPTCPGAPAVPPDPAGDAALTAADRATWTSVVPPAFPQMVMALPSCTTPLVTLVPGTYDNQAALRTLINGCANTVFWFKPGVYNFDFRDGAGLPHEWIITPLSSSVIVGGTPAGWTEGTTTPGNVPFPGLASRAAPASPGASACSTTAPGVEFIFAGDSRMTVSAGRIQLCAWDISATRQHVVLYGPTATTALPATTVPVSPAAKQMNPNGAVAWAAPDKAGGNPDGSVADVTIPNRSFPHSIIEIGPFPSNMVSLDATNITVSITTTHQLTGIGTATMNYIAGDGSGNFLQPIQTCSVACNDASLLTDTVTFPAGVGVTQVNGGRLQYDLAATSATVSMRSQLDGLVVTLTYTSPIRATTAAALAAPMLRASGVSGNVTVLAIHGTIYAPLDFVDLGMTGVENTVVDRGLVVRHLQLSMTPAGTFAPLISVPGGPQNPRQVLLTVTDAGGTVLLRVEAKLTDALGTANGSIPTVLSWSNQ